MLSINQSEMRFYLIGQLHVSITVQEKVARVEISDDDLAVVETGQDRDQLRCPGPDQFVRQLSHLHCGLVQE